MKVPLVVSACRVRDITTLTYSSRCFRIEGDDLIASECTKVCCQVCGTVSILQLIN